MTKPAKIKGALLALALVLAATSALALPVYTKNDFKLDFSGYLQGQGLDSRDFFGAPFDLAQFRFRPVVDFNFGHGFSANIAQTFLASSGNALHNQLFELADQVPPPTYFKWNKRLGDDDDFKLDWSVYRAWVQYENEKIKIQVGRQRIAFGSAYFYSPLTSTTR